jgi:long-chain acyl-CoA synthetase
MEQPHTSIPGLVTQNAALHGEETILRVKRRGIWETVTWRKLGEKVQQIGAALLAANIARGDVVGILSETRPEAVYADLAILGCGAASVAIDPDDDADRIWRALSSSGSRFAFVENEEQLDKILLIRERCPALARIVVFDMKGLRDFHDTHCLSLLHFIETGGAADWTASARALASDQPAVIQFSRDEGSGLQHTLTHNDVMHLVRAARAQLPMRPNDNRLAILRLSDMAERIWGLYLALETRCVSNYPESPDTVVENLRELKPTIFGGDDAVWHGLHALASVRAKAATSAQRLAYEWAVATGPSGGGTARLANLLVLQAVRREFGLSRIRLAYVGGASVSPATVKWARCLGITIERVDDRVTSVGKPDDRRRTFVGNAYA